MRHVDDGDLHAYLDGGLEHYAPDEAERIRAHLEACATCQARLERARGVRDGATGVLAGSTPVAGDPPPFEELRRRARGSAGSTRDGARKSLGRTDVLRMAATAVVALGVGWMAGRAGPVPVGPPGSFRTSGDAAAPAPGSVTGRDEAPSRALAEPRGPAATGAGERPEGDAPPSGGGVTARTSVPAAEAEPAGRSGTPAETHSAAAAPEVTTRSSTPEPAPEPAPRVLPEMGIRAPGPEARAVRPMTDPSSFPEAPAVTPTGAPTERAGRTMVAGSVAAAAEKGVGQAVAPELRVGVDSASRDLPRVRSSLSVEAGRAAMSSDEETLRRRRDDAAAELPLRATPSFPPREPEAREARRRLTVPGLAVVSVEWTEVAPGVDGLRVVQRLVTGDTIELRFGGLDGSGVSPDYLLRETLADGVRQVSGSFDEGWVVARARLDEDQIRALLALIS